jgi:hypothetical protein
MRLRGGPDKQPNGGDGQLPNDGNGSLPNVDSAVDALADAEHSKPK